LSHAKGLLGELNVGFAGHVVLVSMRDIDAGDR
jgi:hypothetical protein